MNEKNVDEQLISYNSGGNKIIDFAPAIMETLGFGVMLIDADTHRIIYTNSKIMSLGGYPEGTIIGQTCHNVVCPAEMGHCPITDKGQLVDNSERTMVRADGTKMSIIKTAVPFTLNGNRYLIESIVDNTERKIIREQLMKSNEKLRLEIIKREQAQEKVNHLAFHDHLTGLANRLLFSDQLSHAILLSDRMAKMLAILYLDLDGFKMINDTMGHTIGDQLLVEVSKRLVNSVRKSDLFARIGGDEFIIMIENIEDIETVNVVAEKVLTSFNRPYKLNNQDVFITASIGVAIYPSDGDNAETLIKNADIAMYKAKENGRNQYLLCTPVMKTNISETMKLSNQLYGALNRNELELYYQPQVNCKSKTIIGLEALLRWNHPERGLVSPGKFIPIAEHTGLIIPIGEWVLRTACKQNKAWQDAGFPQVPVAVNLSVRQFQNSDLVKQVEEILLETRLDPRYLELEITESIVMKETAYVVDILSALRKRGIAISIDDFGTEYSSLNYLKQLPVDKIKIAMPFVQGISVSDKDEAITKAIIVLARNLGLRVIAEGVKTKKQLSFLSKRMCDEIQGFYYYKPMPVNEVKKLFEENIGQVSS